MPALTAVSPSPAPSSSNRSTLAEPILNPFAASACLFFLAVHHLLHHSPTNGTSHNTPLANLIPTLATSLPSFPSAQGNSLPSLNTSHLKSLTNSHNPVYLPSNTSLNHGRGTSGSTISARYPHARHRTPNICPSSSHHSTSASTSPTSLAKPSSLIRALCSGLRTRPTPPPFCC
ncbi:hypothetical protein VTI74DRAFT_4466 [Chaetomium olivicolor]